VAYAGALVYGLFALNETWDFLSLNAEDNWLHAALALVGVALAAVAANDLRHERSTAARSTRGTSNSGYRGRAHA